MGTPFFGIVKYRLATLEDTTTLRSKMPGMRRSKILDHLQLPIHASRIFLHIRKCGVWSQVSRKPRRCAFVV